MSRFLLMFCHCFCVVVIVGYVFIVVVMFFMFLCCCPQEICAQRFEVGFVLFDYLGYGIRAPRGKKDV